MLAASLPPFFNVPFANGAGASYIRAIPLASQIGVTPGAASLVDGFPPLCFLPVSAGGVPPFGQDMNGILNEITANLQWLQAGGVPAYNAAFSAAIGGYPQGSVLKKAAAVGFWISTADNNASDPDTGGAGWEDYSTALLASAVLTGTPTAPTPATGDDSARIATTAFVAGALGDVKGNAAGWGSFSTPQTIGHANAGGCWDINANVLIQVDTSALAAGDRFFLVANNSAFTLQRVDGGAIGVLGYTNFSVPVAIPQGDSIELTWQGSALVVTGGSFCAVYSHGVPALINAALVPYETIANASAVAGNWSSVAGNGNAAITLTAASYGQLTILEAPAGTVQTVTLPPPVDGRKIGLINFTGTLPGASLVAATGGIYGPGGTYDYHSAGTALVLPYGATAVFTSDGSNWIFESGSLATLGINQPPVDVAGSRAFNTTFTNLTGRPLPVHVDGLASQSAQTMEALVTDGAGNAVTIFGTAAGSANWSASIDFTVPPNGTYKVWPSAGSFSSVHWVEMRTRGL
ncbi:hypothetical protein GALL_207810 [mine drainage metagenome]|uniref:Uncharacterized protein n=1 Tax=mine drainage metagenome TaxID=410659 RepID=A0A1J5S612_9ZZZZ